MIMVLIVSGKANAYKGDDDADEPIDPVQEDEDDFKICVVYGDTITLFVHEDFSIEQRDWMHLRFPRTSWPWTSLAKYTRCQPVLIGLCLSQRSPNLSR